MAEQYIFTIEHLSKAYGKREVLKNIWLAFYPGAKIGVIGSNGAGKSSLLRIMALARQGLPRHRPADVRLHASAIVPQEPRLDETKDVRGNIEEAVAATRALLNRHEETRQQARRGARPDADGEAAWTSWARVQDDIDAANAWELDRQLEIAMDAMRLPPARRQGRPPCPAANGGASPCARCCCKSPICCCSMSRPTISTPSRSPGWNGTCRSITGTVVAVTHDRYFLDNVAQWILELDRGEGIPFKGNYSSWLEQKQERLEKEEKQESARRKALDRELEWATHGAAGPRRQEQGPPGRV